MSESLWFNRRGRATSIGRGLRLNLRPGHVKPPPPPPPHSGSEETIVPEDSRISGNSSGRFQKFWKTRNSGKSETITVRERGHHFARGQRIPPPHTLPQKKILKSQCPSAFTVKKSMYGVLLRLLSNFVKFVPGPLAGPRPCLCLGYLLGHRACCAYIYVYIYIYIYIYTYVHMHINISTYKYT